MLHSYPQREGQPAWPWWLYLMLLAWCAGLAVFFMAVMPHSELLYWYAFFLLLVLLPLPAALMFFFGRRAVQVEHAGVVLSTWLAGHRLRQRAFTAARVLAFDWAEEGGAFACRLFVTPYEGAQHAMRHTMLTTRSPYAAAALLRDLELHYPGSGLNAESPVRLNRRFASRWLGGLVLLLAAGYAALMGPRLLLPLRVAAEGQELKGRLERVIWEQPRRDSTYRLLVQIPGQAAPVESARSYRPGLRPPAPGQLLSVRYVPGELFYESNELMAYILVLPLGALGLLMFFMGALVCLRLRDDGA